MIASARLQSYVRRASLIGLANAVEKRKNIMVHQVLTRLVLFVCILTWEQMYVLLYSNNL